MGCVVRCVRCVCVRLGGRGWGANPQTSNIFTAVFLSFGAARRRERGEVRRRTASYDSTRSPMTSCEPWCQAPWNCVPSNARDCGGCEACIGVASAAGAASTTGGSQCEPWCAAPYTCAQRECTGCTACAPNPPPPPLTPTKFGSVNPFLQPGGWYASPTLRANVLGTLARASDASPSERAALNVMARSPSAFWLDTTAKLRGKNDPNTLEGVLYNASAMAAATGTRPALCVFVCYNLPHRDCNAKASRGEIDELSEYKTGYVDVFAALLREYRHVPIAIIIEPDSLGNLVASTSSEAWQGGGCTAQVATAYRDGITYAVAELSAASPDAALYIDAGHGGYVAIPHPSFECPVLTPEALTTWR